MNYKKLNDLKERLFPQKFTCEVCGVELFGGREGDRFCDLCKPEIHFNDKTRCPVCGRRFVYNEVCFECKNKPPVFTRAVSAFVYDGHMPHLILKFKNGAKYLKDFFAEEIYKRLDDFPEFDGIVYVPMTAMELFNRGYNQSRALANSLSRLIGVPVIKKAVIKTERTKHQKNLNRAEREKNLLSCFEVDEPAVRGKTLLVVDDVLTTGATLNAVSAALYKAGCERVYAATVASVEQELIKENFDFAPSTIDPNGEEVI